jgi:hypothetical protein
LKEKKVANGTAGSRLSTELEMIEKSKKSD